MSSIAEVGFLLSLCTSQREVTLKKRKWKTVNAKTKIKTEKTISALVFRKEFPEKNWRVQVKVWQEKEGVCRRQRSNCRTKGGREQKQKHRWASKEGKQAQFFLCPAIGEEIAGEAEEVWDHQT